MSQNIADKITIISTAYNEEESLENFFEACNSIRKILEIEFPIVLVNNGSTDLTLTILNAFASRSRKVTVIDNPHGKGYGDGINAAIEKVMTPYVLILPSDLQFSAADATKVIKHFIELYNFKEQHLNILTFRKRRLDSIYNRIRGQIWKLFLRSLFRLPRALDPASQLKLICTDCCSNISESSFLWDVVQSISSCASASKAEVVPVTLYARAHGNSSLKGSPMENELLAFRRLMAIRKEMSK